MPLLIRAAGAADAPLIRQLVVELAEYEKLAHAVEATEADLAHALFAPSPRVFAEIAELDGRPIGFSLWFYTFSTFVGRAGVYLEDLYVRPDARGQGAGRALMASLARRCVEEQLGRMEWAVLDWNAPAIAVYDRVGSSSMNDWTLRRLTGEPLRALAAG